MTLYFTELNKEIACTKESIIADMKEYGMETLVVSKAVRDKSGDGFFCKKFGEFCLRNDGQCSKDNCILYSPRNGRSGICRHWRHCYEPGEEFLLNVNGKIERVTK